MMDEILKDYEGTKKEIALEIMKIFKSKNLPVTLIDDVMEYAKQNIHSNARL